MNKEKEEVEIDLLELGKKLWDNKKFIIKCSIIGAIVGLVIAFSIPKEYTTRVVLATESPKLAGGSMGALASMAGLNLGNNQIGDILSPELYPDVLNSTPFVQGLLDVYVEDQNMCINTSLYNYLRDEYKKPWWSYILGIPNTLVSLVTPQIDQVNIKKSRSISEEELILIDRLRNSYSINTDKKTGITQIEVTVQSPEISAFLADTLTSYLQLYIIEQRTKKAKEDLISNEQLYIQAKKDYNIARESLAKFVDRNHGITSAIYKINEKKLEDETSIAYSVYSQMAQQVQINKIKVQDNTPIFTIIQPALIPIRPSKPSKALILVSFIFLSFIGSSFWTTKTEIKQILNTKP